MKFSFRPEWFSWLTIIAVVVIAIWAYPRLPEMVPSHWNAAGQVDDYSTRLTHSLLFPGMMIGMYLLFLALPYLEPRRGHFIKSWGFYAIIRNAMMAFFLLMFSVATWAGLAGEAVPMGTIIPLAIGLLFIIIGNYMPQIKSNFFMGIRNPWTLSSDIVWEKTHTLGGYVFILGGLAFFATPFLPDPINFYLPMAVLLVGVSAIMIYSYLLFRGQKS